MLNVLPLPLAEECTAHLECVLDGFREYGGEVMIFERVVAAATGLARVETISNGTSGRP